MVDRSLILAGAATSLFSLAALPAASLADGPYLSLLVGGVNTETVEADDIEVEYDTGFAIGGQFGYRFDIFRLGGALDYRVSEGLSDNDVNAEVDITRFTLNGQVDLPLAPNLVPYVGGGFGVANVRAGEDLSDDFEDEDSAFTWHAEVGAAIYLNDFFALAPTYRYEWVDTDIGGQSEPLISHIFGATLRFDFPGPGSRRYADASDSDRRVYESGYTSYGAGYRSDPFYYDRFDRYDHYHHHHDDDRKTPEEIERDKCGWQGPGCEED